MDAPVSQGRVLLGKYRVERVIGKGAMGVVVAARHIQLEDRVAIKLLLPEMMEEPGVVDRFLQEARAVRKIKSEHVPHVADVGLLESGTPYIIMEYLEGKDLAKLRSERGPLNVEEVTEYILQAGEALAEAHHHGIIHRDLKPANLFLTRRPDGSPLVKVLDFGTSKLCRKETASKLEMTQTGMAIGSPSYMSPEQMLSSRNLDARADIWALGVIVYNLLTGTFPFRAESLLQMCAAVIQTRPEPPTTYRPDLPAGLEAAILRCLEKKPEDRFADMAEFARAILPFAPPHARLSVERIERVLGVTGDLAPFLAPSFRNPVLPGLSRGPAEKEPLLAASTPSGDGLPSGQVHAMSTSSLASVVRHERAYLADGAVQPAKRGRSALLVGVGAFIALCIGLLLTHPGSRYLLTTMASPAPAAGQTPSMTVLDVGSLANSAVDETHAEPPPAPSPVATMLPSPPLLVEPAPAPPSGTPKELPKGKPAELPLSSSPNAAAKAQAPASSLGGLKNQPAFVPAGPAPPSNQQESALKIPDDR